MKRGFLFRLRKDYKAKLASVLIATALWAYVQNRQIQEITLNVPVQYQNLSDELVFTDEPPRYLKITLRGKKDDLKFPSSHLRATVDLSAASPGKKFYPVLFDVRQLPENIRLRKEQLRVKLTLERLEKKTVRVRLNLKGTVAAGYRVGRKKIIPDKVTIQGPRTTLNDIRFLETKPINLSDRSETIHKQVRLNHPANVRILDHQKVTAHITIFKENTVNERKIDNVPLRSENLDPALEAVFSNNTVSVFVQGPPDILKKVSAKDLHAWVDLEGTRLNQKTGHILPFDNEPGIPVSVKMLRYGGKVSIINIVPEQVTVRFRIKPGFEGPPPKSNETTEEESKSKEETPLPEKEEP